MTHFASSMVPASPPASRHAFRAMGVGVEVMVDEVPEESWPVLEAAEREFHRLEAIFSRFRPDSELSALNSSGTLAVGPELLEVIELALAARALTDGRFDPTVLNALVAAGYDRSFDKLTEESGLCDEATRTCNGSVIVDRRRSTISLSEGVCLDLGGIAKGYAVDRVCDLVEVAGPCLVNAGGDLAVRRSLAGSPWPIACDTPDGTLVLGLSSGALATSGRDFRRWRQAGRERHHLIDPATGAPGNGDLARVTVVAATALEAEIAAKSLFLAGERVATSEADRDGMPCVLVTRDARVVLAGGLA